MRIVVKTECIMTFSHAEWNELREANRDWRAGDAGEYGLKLLQEEYAGNFRLECIKIWDDKTELIYSGIEESL